MLSESVRKTILEHNLLYYIENDSNPSQARKRIRKQCHDAIMDLTLIAQKSSEETIDDIFEIELLFDLLASLLLVDQTSDQTRERPPNAKLANIFAHFGILTCLREYQNNHFDIPEATKLVTEHLQRAHSICNGIERKAIKDYILRKIEEGNGEYICDFSELFNVSNGKFAKYIEKELNIHPEFFKRVLVEEKPYLLGAKFLIYDDLEILGGNTEEREEKLIGEVDINYDQARRRGTISLIDTKKNAKVIDFVVEEYLRKERVIHKKPKNKEEQNE
jgi:hypothetical protein